MKITSLKATQPETPEAPQDWRTWFGQIAVTVKTDEGLTGIGIGGGGVSGIHVIETELRALLLGRDPFHIEQLWDEMYRATLPYGRKGLAIMAISGVDLALWDLKAKAAGQSVAGLLGCKSHRPIPTYRTVIKDLDEALKEGHAAFKLHLGKFDPNASPQKMVDFVKEARDKVGPDTKLMVDAFMNWDVDTALRVSEWIHPYDIEWLEEPLPSDDWAGYAKLRDQCPIPIAGGEHEYTSAAFKEIIDQRLHQVVQPDICWCGGLTEVLRIYELVKGTDIRICQHRGSEVWGLHAIAAEEEHPLAESGRPWMHFVKGQPKISNGLICLPEKPGFGVWFDE
ncbi:MAG: mandelate racemase/muconate lactonizing enzyme family protein [Planctomycetota bacterium]|jgi:L-rhamnonate dehydratase|nr:mandelate racemase/muconate lactonizing enzyme family protein [Planctomycetota bacterium]